MGKSTYADFLVTKRKGGKEPFDPEKIHRVLTWASEDLENVSISQVEIKAKIQFFDGISTNEIHKMLIKSAADLISIENSDYQYFASRLLIFSLRKRVYGTFKPWSIATQVKKMTTKGLYTEELLEKYSTEDWEIMDKWLGDHERDFLLPYAAIKQLEGKYLIQDRTSLVIYETPQFLYMLIAATIMIDEPSKTRLMKVKEYYDAFSTFKLSLPTPIMSGVRTSTKQYSSCVLIECGDSLESINATASTIVKYISQKSGLGINAGRIRGIGSKIRGGEVLHTGCIPFYKYFQAAVKSCSQGGVRGGAATVFFPIWHIEVENLMVLKNNRGIDDNRARHLDYAVQINQLFYKRLQTGSNITLFSPNDVHGLYDAFFEDQQKFSELYISYENDSSIQKKSIPATELFSILAQERMSTGRIYIQNVDHCNTHSPFRAERAPIRQSNLCMEVLLPTSPMAMSYNGKNEEIALCVLGALNLGVINSLEDLFPMAEQIVLFLDKLLDKQTYLLESAKLSATQRRSIGIGVVNFAYYLAKLGVKYSDNEALKITHQAFETFQFALLRASCNLAMKYGPCKLFEDTNYSKGLLPIDTYKKSVDEIYNETYINNWDDLRSDIIRFGLRNSTLSCLMPSETSSQILNATNGIEPPRGLVSIKASKDGILKQVVPEIKKLKNNYELLWDFNDNIGYIRIVAIMQKFIDQAISVNLSYDPSKFLGGKVPVKKVLQDILISYKYGIKNLYYHNTRDGMKDPNTELEDNCLGGACII